MKHFFLYLFSCLALATIVLSVILASDIESSKFSDVSFLSALFSLAGVFIFSAALVYQIKEFQLQQVELKKSVEAQTNNSKALEEQRKIMLEQKANEFLLGITNQFISYATNDRNKSVLNNYFEHLSSYLFYINKFDLTLRQNNPQKTYNEFSSYIESHIESFEFKNDAIYLWGFTSKILRTIESNEAACDLNPFFVSHTLNQLSPIVVHFITLGEISGISPKQKRDKHYFREEIAIKHMVENFKKAKTDTKRMLVEQLVSYFKALPSLNLHNTLL